MKFILSLLHDPLWRVMFLPLRKYAPRSPRRYLGLQTERVDGWMGYGITEETKIERI